MRRDQQFLGWRSSVILLLGLLVMSMAMKGAMEERSIFLVLMKGDPVAFHSAAAANVHAKRFNASSHKVDGQQLVDSHDQFLANKLEYGTYQKLYSFHHIANGFAVHTTPSQVKRLELAEGVKMIEKDGGVKLMTTYTPDFLGLPQGVWSWGGGGGIAGDGIVIGIVDTGINPSHPSFAYDPSIPFHQNHPHFSGACETGPLFLASSCNGKIVSARYFAKGASAYLPLNPSKDFLSPFDAVGHGSHVASVAAGNSGVPVVVDGFNYGVASGMAPRARIAVYKAIYPTGGTLSDVIAAIDKAAEDGVDVIILSIGPDEPPEDTITFLNIFEIFLLFARKAGIFVVQAAGNKGPAVASVVSFSPWAVGVGASTTDRRYPAALILGNGQKIPAVGLSGPAFGEELSQFRLVLAKDAFNRNGSFPLPQPYSEECQLPNVFDPAVVRGSIVICSFSAGFRNRTSTIASLVSTAIVSGFKGFVLAANLDYGDYIAPPIPFSLPGLMIPRTADVQILLEYYQHQTDRSTDGHVLRYGATTAMGEGRIASFGEEAPIVSRFSSRGPDIIDSHMTLADVLKPDVVAPGDLVWGAWSPLSVTEPILTGYQFAPLSGTSMAAPHVGGIAALVKQAHPSWSPSMIASAISTTASQYDNRGRPILAEGPNLNQLYVSGHFDHGAGHVNPVRAIDPGLVFYSEFGDYIKFLCSLPNMNATTIKLVTGQICNPPLFSHPADLNLPSLTISSLNNLHTTHRSVTNVAGKPEMYTCSVQQPLGVEVGVWPPWFIISPQQTIRLEIKLNATQVLEDFSFGEIVLTGSLNHIVRVPISVLPVLLL